MDPNESSLSDILKKQRIFFATNQTKDISFRIEKLRLLHKSILKHENAIYVALKKDLHKSKVEAFEGEIYPVLSEISYVMKHLRSWAKEHRVKGPRLFPFGRGYVQEMPYGIATIFSPFNHPFSTSFTPIVSAVAAGNCVILKPSELVEHAGLVIRDIIRDVFPEDYVSVVIGGKEVSQALLDLSVDTIFFTGSTKVGKIVMEAAAKQLIPVTLQLGGKCVGVVDKGASIPNAAARIVWGKFWNAGQSCNTVDHIFVHESVKDEFVLNCKKYITQFFTENPETSSNYGRIISEMHVERIARYLQDGEVLFGGVVDKIDRYISPTLISSVKEGAPVLEEEIFGPVLPIFVYSDINDVIKKIQKQPKALALYIFSKDSHVSDLLIKNIDSGTVCVNDLMIQATSPEMPIGGVGDSGFGRMRGKAGFDMFSYKRSIFKHVTFDFPFRFPPYREKFLLAILKKFFL